MRINKASKPKMASSCDQTWSYECSFTKMFSFKKQSWHSSYIKASYHPLMTYFCRDGMFLPILPQPRTALTSENGSFCFKQLIWTRNLRPENKENRFSLGVYHKKFNHCLSKKLNKKVKQHFQFVHSSEQGSI